MSEPPGAADIPDFSDLDDEDLACLGLRRRRASDDDPFFQEFEELRRKRYEDFLANLPKPRKPRKPRKPSIGKLVEQAKAAGVTSVTLPDGTKLDFGNPETATPENPWLADLRKEAKQ